MKKAQSFYPNIILLIAAFVAMGLYVAFPSIALSILSAVIFLQLAQHQKNHALSSSFIGIGALMSTIIIWYNYENSYAVLICLTTHLIAYLFYYFVFYQLRQNSDRHTYQSKLLQEVYNNSPEAIFLQDYYSQNIVDCNERAVELFECKDKSDIIGINRDVFIVDNLTKEELEASKKSIALTGVWEQTVLNKTKQNNSFWARVTTKPLQVGKLKYYITRVLDVTEHIEAEDNFFYVNKRLNRVINAMDGVVYSAEIKEGKEIEVTYVSDRLKEVFGISKNEYIELNKSGNIINYIHPNDVEIFLGKIQKEQPSVRVYRFNNPEKQRYIWIEDKVTPKYNDKGIHISNFGISTDITSRIENKQALQDSKERYVNLFERNLAGVYQCRIEDKIIIGCNTAFAQLLGYNSTAEIIGKPTPSLYKQSSGAGSFHERIQQEKSIMNQETRLILINGEEKWIMENTIVVEDDGKSPYIEGIIIDITSLKQTEAALKQSEENLSLIVNSLDDIIYNIEVDATGNHNFKYISSQVTEVLGLSIRQYKNMVAEKTLIDHIHPEEKEDVSAMMEIIDYRKMPMVLNYRFKNSKTGNYQWLEENIYPKVVDGKIVAKFGIIRDISCIGLDGKMLESNKSFAQLLGYTEAAVKQIDAKNLFFDKNDYVSFLRHAKEQGLLLNYELKLKRYDNSELWTLINCIYDQKQNLLEGTLINITELKITGEALKESEETLSTLIDKLPGMAYRCKLDNKWTMEYISDGCLELTGYHAFELINNSKISFNEIIHPDFRNGVKTVLKRIQNHTQRRFVFEYKIIEKSGKEKWVWEQGQLIIDNKGKPIALEGFITDITARKTNENIINQRKEEYQSLIDTLPYGIVIHQQGKIRYVNNIGYSIIGVKLDYSDIFPRISKYKKIAKKYNIKQKNIYEYILPKYHKEQKARAIRLLEGKEVDFYENELINIRGEIIDIESKGKLITYEGLPAIQVVFRDISVKKQLVKEQARATAAEEQNIALENEIKEHKQTQKQLKESQGYSKNLIDSSLDMIVATDINGKINEINQAGLDRFNYSQEEIIGQSPTMLFQSPEDYRILLEKLETNGKYIGEVENIDKYGRQFSSILSCSQIKDEEGNVLGVMGISKDITEIKDVEKILSTQSSVIKSIFESNSNMLIWIVDTQFNYISFNRSYLNLLQLVFGKWAEKGENMVDSLQQHLEKGERDKLHQYINRAMKGANEQFELIMHDKRGNPFWLELYLCPIILEDGTIKEIACLAHEVTDKKFAEEKIKESLSEKEILLKEVHHRVKNNLQVISSILNLQSAYVSDSNTLNILRESQNRIKSMSFIHESLYQTKDFSSINFTEYIINLAKNLVHTYQIQPGKIQQNYNMQELDLELDQAIPCGLIINELVSNALKYAFTSSKEGNSITVGLKEEKNRIHLSVEDNGVGLPKGFDPNETNTLGLQLVVTLVEQLDGNMVLSAEHGTKYLITFERQTHVING